MIISPPFLPQSGLTLSDTDTDPMMTAVRKYERGYHGCFPVTFDRRWHCGIHLVPDTQDEPVRAIADGEVVAYRVAQDPIGDGHKDESGHEVLNTNTGFVLLRHVTDTGEGRTLTYYSLYMNLLDLTAQGQLAPQSGTPPQHTSPTALAAWLLATSDVTPGNGKRVYRKDILGYWGQSQGLRHLHFEVFMTEDDFAAWFQQAGHEVQLAEKSPVQPTSNDWWGHAYFVIPATVVFVSRPDGPSAQAWFPELNAGRLPDEKSRLYVEAYFHKGQRFTRAWLDENGDGECVLLTPEPVKDRYRDYEYKLYERAMALYPKCPSDGYELLRFGRILCDSPTLLTAAEKATWVAVPFDTNGTQGYVDISQLAVIKLSDADFPACTGWQKIDAESAPTGADGLFSYNKLCRLNGDTPESPSASAPADPSVLNQQLADYVQGDDGAWKSMTGFVCHTKSEWDPVNNEERYGDLDRPDGYFGQRKETDPDGYAKYLGFVKKLQFLDQVASLSGGKKFWFFHPLTFIGHFRKCGWLSVLELSQTIPRRLIEQTKDHANQIVYPTSEMRWSVALSRSRQFIRPLNLTFRKYCLSLNGVRLSYFLGNAIQETAYLSRTTEDGGGQASYAPWFGRGVIQLTFEENYKRYGQFKGWNDAPSNYRDSLGTNLMTASDSAGFYWISCAKPVGHTHNINVEADVRPELGQMVLSNICSSYSYPHHVCQVGLSVIEFRFCHEFERAGRAVNTGNPNSSHPMNGLIPRTNVFLTAMAVLSDEIVSYQPAYGQKPDQ